jgi:glycosyltransferase involved in cell wall biosynthesis
MSAQTSKVQLPASPKRVALVHDWLIGGGAELVVLELHRMFPDAPIYTSYCTNEWRKRLDGKVITGWLQWWPFSKLYKFLPILRIWWFTRLRFDDYDLVISSSGNGEAKGVKVPVGIKHICYCHSPTHFYWRNYQQYLAHPKSGWLNPIARLGLRLLVKPLRRWDYHAAQRPDVMIANSTHIQKDIRKYYDRDSTVVFPPVDVARFSPPSTFNLPPSNRHGFVTVGRQVPYKRIDLVVAACTQLELPLTVVGNGPEHDRLVKMAGPSITFVTDAEDDAVARHLAAAKAFLFAGIEDFGITMAEALAAGCPVVSYRAGGALDIVQEGENGLFFDQQTVESLVEALQDFPKHHFDSKVVTKTADRFSVHVFQVKLRQFIDEVFSRL